MAAYPNWSEGRDLKSRKSRFDSEGGHHYFFRFLFFRVLRGECSRYFVAFSRKTRPDDGGNEITTVPSGAPTFDKLGAARRLLGVLSDFDCIEGPQFIPSDRTRGRRRARRLIVSARLTTPHRRRQARTDCLRYFVASHSASYHSASPADSHQTQLRQLLKICLSIKSMRLFG